MTKQRIKLKWENNARFLGETTSGLTLPIEGPPEHGGTGEGIRPMEMILFGLVGCASTDIINMLMKAKEPIIAYEAFVTGKRTDSVPSLFEHIIVDLEFTGHPLNLKKIERAISLTKDKYCSASILLKNAGVTIDFFYTIKEHIDETT